MNILNPNEVADRLRNLIKKNNMKLVDVANHLGLKKGSFQAYVDGSRVPPTESLFKLSLLLNVSMEYILTGNEGSGKNLSNCSFPNALNGYDLLSPSEKEKLQIYIEVCNSSKSYKTYKTPKEIKDNIQYYDFPTVDTLPILGRVAAGNPIEIIQLPLGYLKVSTPADYALIVEGDSMDPIIKNNEYIFVKQTSSLENGDIGVFFIDGETTCKLFYKDEKNIVLKSLNQSFKPFKFSLNSSNEFQALGKVILTNEQKERYKFFS